MDRSRGLSRKYVRSINDLNFFITSGADLNARDKEGSTPLLYACNYKNDAEALFLLQHGADPNLSSKWGRTPLMYASDKGEDDVVTALIQHKVDLNATCSDGPALNWAAGSNHLSTLKLLLDAGADPKVLPQAKANECLLGVLAKAACTGNVEMVTMLLDRGVNVDQPCTLPNTPLISAASWDQLECIKKLVEKGAKIDARDYEGSTALISASQNYDDVASVDTLCKAGASLNLKGIQGRTALIWAVHNGRQQVARYLVDQGADLSIKDDFGATALAYAFSEGYIDLAAYLLGHGAPWETPRVLVLIKPSQVLTPAQNWQLALSAVYTQEDGMSNQILGTGTDEDDVRGIKEMLKRDWEITDHAGLVRQIKDLVDHGHHTSFQELGKKLAAMNEADFQKELAAHKDTALKLDLIRRGYIKWKERYAVAWDWCRAARLVNSAACTT